MNRTQIQAVRRLLFLSAVEAGRYIALDEEHPNGVAANTWHKWEKGEKPIPERIGVQLESLLLRREAEILRIENNARNGSPFFALWYENRADCLPFSQLGNNEPSVVDWKLSQSETFAKFLSPNSRNLNKDFRLFLFQISTDSTQIPP